MGPVTVISSEREHARLQALRRYSVLDTAPEAAFDDLVREAAALYGAPAAALTFVDSRRCWFKARTGLDESQAPRDISFCGHAFGSSGIFVVPDARADERFRHLPLVTAAGFRFYAGAPLLTPDGHSLGTLCVLDRAPRTPVSAELDAHRALADRVLTLLEARVRDLAPAPPAAVAPPRRRVLVVDDEILIRDFVRQLLGRRGFDSVEAANGAEALALFREQADHIGLVLTDLHMPVMTGLELLHSLRDEPDPPALAVMSGRLDPGVRSKLHAAGVRCVLPKPFPLEEFETIFSLLPA